MRTLMERKHNCFINKGKAAFYSLSWIELIVESENRMQSFFNQIWIESQYTDSLSERREA